MRNKKLIEPKILHYSFPRRLHRQEVHICSTNHFCSFERLERTWSPRPRLSCTTCNLRLYCLHVLTERSVSHGGRDNMGSFSTRDTGLVSTEGLIRIRMLTSAHWMRKRLPRGRCDAVVNKLTTPNIFISYVSFCRAASISASSVGAIRIN